MGAINTVKNIVRDYVGENNYTLNLDRQIDYLLIHHKVEYQGRPLITYDKNTGSVLFHFESTPKEVSVMDCLKKPKKFSIK